MSQLAAYVVLKYHLPKPMVGNTKHKPIMIQSINVNFILNRSVIRAIDLLLRIFDNDPETFSRAQAYLPNHLSLRPFSMRQLVCLPNPDTSLVL